VIQDKSGAGTFPVGLIPWDLPEVESQQQEPSAYTDTRIIRIINAALEQIRPEIEKAIATYGPERIGVCLGSCDNGSEGSLLAHQAFLANGSFPSDYNLRFQSASFPGEFISRKFGLKGPVLTVATACASGASAIARGAELIRSGFCDAVIAGGADIVSETVFLGFHALEALSDNLSNPFSKNRKGINLGEGAAFFLLDSSVSFGPTAHSEQSNNGEVELLGAGESADAYHMTAPGPDGAGPAKALKAALDQARLSPEQIGYVNLHGTGTELNDKAEALAMTRVFGEKPPLASSTKPIMGHTLGAAGALETAICWMVLRAQKGLPLHCWDAEKDDEIPFLPLVSKNELKPARPVSTCMSNSFAFGGCNVSIILQKNSGSL
jgi:3-oxoacyl-[acyl-carrier-protein] synthase-1